MSNNARERGTGTASPRPPRMQDVARVAGVSHQTVSRVLNDSPGVRPETRQQVLDAISQLGYRRNLSARTLVTRHSQTLGVISFDTTRYGPATTLSGIEQAARAAGYFISIILLEVADRDSVLSALDRLLGQAVEGIIVVAPQLSASGALWNLPLEVPVVAIEGGPGVPMPTVRIDQPTGARMAVRHLLDLGHRSVWHVAGPQDWIEARGRIRGWRMELRKSGAPVPPVLYGDWTARSGYLAGRQLAGEPEATAIFAGNDQMALGVLRALREAGRRVPEDVSIIGFDDTPESGYFSPPLTTLRQDFGQVGRACLRLLVDRIEGAAEPAAAGSVPPELVVRDSTAAATKPARG